MPFWIPGEHTLRSIDYSRTIKTRLKGTILFVIAQCVFGDHACDATAACNTCDWNKGMKEQVSLRLVHFTTSCDFYLFNEGPPCCFTRTQHFEQTNRSLLGRLSSSIHGFGMRARTRVSCQKWLVCKRDLEIFRRCLRRGNGKQEIIY